MSDPPAISRERPHTAAGPGEGSPSGSRVPDSPPAPPPPGLTVEAEILLAACRHELDPQARRGRLRELLQQVWEANTLWQFAITGRVIPALGAALSDCADLVPPPFLAAVDGLRRQWALTNLQHTAELARITRRLEGRGAPCLVYKGPALAAWAYGSITGRHFRDLDLLVRPEEVRALRAELIDDGYAPEVELSPRELERVLSWDCELTFLHPERGTVVEIHWDVFDRHNLLGFEVTDLWERQCEVEISGQRYATLAPEDLLLVLCMHGGEKHRWDRLKWVVDVARLATQGRSIDWREALRRADEIGRRRTVLHGLHLASVVLAAPIPKQLAELAWGDDQVAGASAISRGRMFGGEKPQDPGYAEWRSYVEAHRSAAGLSSLPSPAGASRLQHARLLATPGWSERREWRLPRPLGFLHHIYRPLRVIYRRLRRPLSRPRDGA